MKMITWPWDLIKKAWNVLKTVYSYNSLPWRILKSGGLVVFGFFNLMASNLLYSYNPNWDFLYLFMSYGALLILYGPIHHLVVIPGTINLGKYNWARKLKIPSRGHQVMLILFFLAVIYFSLFPLNIMTFDLSAVELGSTADIDPEVSCWRVEKGSSTIQCEVSDEPGIAKVVVNHNGETILSVKNPPYRFTVDENDLKTVVGQKSFYIIPKDKNNQMLRRYVQQTRLIETRREETGSP